MNIVITGGAGFLGVRLARTLLAQGTLSRAGGAPTLAKASEIFRDAVPKSSPTTLAVSVTSRCML